MSIPVGGSEPRPTGLLTLFDAPYNAARELQTKAWLGRFAMKIVVCNFTQTRPANVVGFAVAKVAELVDALVLGASGATRESSSLSFRTKFTE